MEPAPTTASNEANDEANDEGGRSMQTLTMAAARAVDATKVYGSADTAVPALDEVSVGLPQGCFTAIMGPSGSGKSTLMHCLAGLDQLSSGEVFLGDVELGSLSDTELTLLRRERVGFIFQSFNLLPTLTAAENITLPLLLAGKRPDKDWLDTVIAEVRLGDRLSHRPSELSGGQQQRGAGAWSGCWPPSCSASASLPAPSHSATPSAPTSATSSPRPTPGPMPWSAARPVSGAAWRRPAPPCRCRWSTPSAACPGSPQRS